MPKRSPVPRNPKPATSKGSRSKAAPKRTTTKRSTKFAEAFNKARREGFADKLRKGEGEEADLRAVMAGCVWSQRRADHWLEYADKYGTLTEGPYKGKKFELLEWQKEDTSRLFGWIQWSPEWRAWVRRFRFLYLEVPKKNGKTPLIALIGNYLLFADSWQRQINLYLAATTRKQAERCILHAVRQVRNREALAKIGKIRKLEGFSSIEYGDSSWNVVAADPDSADGVNGHCLADELHRWKGHEFFNSLRYMLASQPEGLFCGITTAGDDLGGVCRQLHEKTKAVNSGRVEDQTFLGRIYAADPEDDPHDERTWYKANPSLGTSRSSPLKLSSFRADYNAAKEEPSTWSSFLRLRLNLWRTATNGWLDEACPRGLANWDAGPDGRREKKGRVDCFELFDPDKLEGIARMGMDFAQVRDTNAAVVSIEVGDLVYFVPFFWLPEAEAMRQSKRVPYQRWQELGFIKLTPGEVVDYETVFADLEAIVRRFRVQRFYYDPLFQGEYLCQRLEAETGAERVAFQQRITEYGPLVRECERRLINGQLRHAGNACLTWQMGNAKAWQNANGDKRLIKQKAGDYHKVDGPQALLMSLRDVVTREAVSDYYADHDVEEF